MTSQSRRQTSITVGIVVMALLVRFAACAYWQNQLAHHGELLRFGDSHSYWTISGHIARGMPYQYGSDESKIFRAPLYPMLLAPILCCTGHEPSWIGVMLARGLGCMLGAWAVWLLMWITRQFGSLRASWWAGLLACFYPGAVGMSIFVLSEAIATPLIAASMALTVCLIGYETVGSGVSRTRHFGIQLALAMGSGGLLGLSALARPSWSLWPLVLTPYLWIVLGSAHQPRIRRLGWIASIAIGMSLAMAPWWIRNWGITGHFVPTTLQVGASLYDGWHAGASGSSDENMDFVFQFIEEQKADDAMLANQGITPQSTFEWRVDRRLGRAAMGWALENPSNVLWLGLVKSIKTWTPLPVAKELSSPSIRWSEAFGYSAIVIGMVIGSWRLRRIRGSWLLIMPCLYLAILHAIFIGSVRYRQPGVLLLCPLAGVGFQAICEWIRHNNDGTSDSQSSNKQALGIAAK